MELEIINRQPETNSREAPLLFVHGAFCGAWVWDEYFLPYFAKRGFAAHAVSLRGHGGSEGHEDLARYRLEDYVEDVVAAVNQIEPTPILIGHSMGGVIVQRYLRHHAAAGAVLLGSGPPSGMLPSGVAMFLNDALLTSQLSLMQSLGTQEAPRKALRRAVFSPSMPKADANAYLARMHNESVLVGLDLLAPHLPRNPHRVPIAVFGAQNDFFIPPVLVRSTAAAYRTRATIFQNLSHLMMLDREWEQVAEAILQWLQSPAAQGRESVRNALRLTGN